MSPRRALQLLLVVGAVAHTTNAAVAIAKSAPSLAPRTTAVRTCLSMGNTLLAPSLSRIAAPLDSYVQLHGNSRSGTATLLAQTLSRGRLRDMGITPETLALNTRLVFSFLLSAVVFYGASPVAWIHLTARRAKISGTVGNAARADPLPKRRSPK